MAKLYFHYSTMNAGKSTALLQASHNYIERGMQTHLINARLDGRAGQGQIGSRIGLSAPADTFGPDTDLFDALDAKGHGALADLVRVHSARWLTSPWQKRMQGFESVFLT